MIMEPWAHHGYMMLDIGYILDVDWCRKGQLLRTVWVPLDRPQFFWSHFWRTDVIRLQDNQFFSWPGSTLQWCCLPAWSDKASKWRDVAPWMIIFAEHIRKTCLCFSKTTEEPDCKMKTIQHAEKWRVEEKVIRMTRCSKPWLIESLRLRSSFCIVCFELFRRCIQDNEWEGWKMMSAKLWQHGFKNAMNPAGSAEGQKCLIQGGEIFWIFLVHRSHR